MIYLLIPIGILLYIIIAGIVHAYYIKYHTNDYWDYEKESVVILSLGWLPVLLSLAMFGILWLLFIPILKIMNFSNRVTEKILNKYERKRNHK